MVRRLRLLIRTLKGPAPIIVGSLVLVLAYQNFSPHEPQSSLVDRTETVFPDLNRHTERQVVTGGNSNSERHRAMNESYRQLQKSNLLSLHIVPEDQKLNRFDIREYAPNRPDHVAFNEGPFRAPEIRPTENSHHRISDAGAVWLEREVKPFLKPLEDEWLEKVNGQLRGLFGSFKPVEGEDWPAPGQEGETSPLDPTTAPKLLPGMPDSPDIEDSKDDFLSLKTVTPEEVKLTKANEVTVAFKHGTLVSCEINSGQRKVRLSRPVSRSSSFDVSHESAENRNSIGFSLSW